MVKQTITQGQIVEEVYLNQSNLDITFTQQEGSTLRLFVVDIQGGQYANHIVVEQAATDCTTEIYHLAYLTDNDKATTHTNVRHLVGGGTSNQLIKFILGGKAKGEFLGELYIAPDAQKTEAHQTNRNLLLSSTAEVRTRPQLEIYADDVKATHGASTGQMDESALFYMQQRCLDENTARRLLLGAFMKDVIEPISDQNKREELLETIDRIIQ